MPGLLRVRERKADDGVLGKKSEEVPSEASFFCFPVRFLLKSLWSADGINIKLWFLENVPHSASGLLQINFLSLSLKLLIIMLTFCCFVRVSLAALQLPHASCTSRDFFSDTLIRLSSSSMYWSLRSRALFKWSTSRWYCWILASSAATVYRPNLATDHLVFNLEQKIQYFSIFFFVNLWNVVYLKKKIKCRNSTKTEI